MSRLIDADALMDASKYEFWQDGSAITPIGEYILGKFRQLIRNMPTIEPEPHWIPVTEQMPEHKGDYLVTFKLLFTYPVEVCYFDGQAWDKGQYDAVLAWMPLQEPYKDGGGA